MAPSRFVSGVNRLTHHDARVGQCISLALLARRQQERAHGRRHPHAHRLHILRDATPDSARPVSRPSAPLVRCTSNMDPQRVNRKAVGSSRHVL
jgi:hypothetical protein